MPDHYDYRDCGTDPAELAGDYDAWMDEIERAYYGAIDEAAKQRRSEMIQAAESFEIDSGAEYPW